MSRHGVAVPADVDLADRVLWGLTVRQVAILAPVALGLLAAWRALLGSVPILVLLAATAPVAAIALALALARVDAVGLDRLAWAALRGPRGRVAAGSPSPDAREVMTRLTGRKPASVRTVTGPARRVRADGLVDLGPGGVAVALDVGFVNFTLRSGSEQSVLVAAFARMLNATDAHIQVVVSARPVDLGGYLAAFDERACRLEGRLAEAAGAHRAWMGELTAGRRLLRREITVVATAASADGAEYAARAIEAAAQAMGVEAARLDGAELAARCRYAVDPFGTATTHTRKGASS
ncbi:hypothetical protein GCM10029992_37410 [Glycomyces albus]